MNYRHQSDVCHAYQLLRKSGVSEDHIILLMQDDVAMAEDNPFQGKLFNKQGSNVPDVHAGCKVDYSGDDVTAELFLKVLTGNATNLPGSGKVLKSGPHDRVFVNFVDHGGVGMVAFPNGPELHVSELSAALKQMQQQRMFAELLFYLESCESGSMFPNLTQHGKILAVTAANAKESSWGFYCSPDDVVDNKHLGTCLGDLFSISWMEDTDQGNLGTESIRDQVQKATARTDQSHVSLFGDTSFESEAIGGFLFGGNEGERRGERRGSWNLRGAEMPKADVKTWSAGGAVDARDISLHTAYQKWAAARNVDKEAAWIQFRDVVESRDADDAFFKALASEIQSRIPTGFAVRLQEQELTMKDSECHRRLVRAVHDLCPRRERESPGGWNSYNMKYSQLLVNMCESRHNFALSVEGLEDVVRGRCQSVSMQRDRETLM